MTYSRFKIAIVFFLCSFSAFSQTAVKNKTNAQLFAEWKFNMKQLRDKAELRVLQLKDFKDSIPDSKMSELQTQYTQVSTDMNSMLDEMTSSVKNNWIVLNRGLVRLSETYETIRARNADQYAIFELNALEALKKQSAGGASFILTILTELGEWLLDKKVQSSVNQLNDLRWRKWEEIK